MTMKLSLPDAVAQAATETTLFGPERELVSAVRQLTGLVGELTVMLVVQGAHLAAVRARRARPSASDVDDAIAAVADNVPDHVADGLWAARDALVARLSAGAGATA